MRNPIRYWLALSAAFWAPVASADFIKLNNRSELTGKIVAQDEQTVMLQMPSGSTLAIDRKEIKAIELRVEPEGPPPEASAPPKASPKKAAPKKPVAKPGSGGG